MIPRVRNATPETLLAFSRGRPERPITVASLRTLGDGDVRGEGAEPQVQHNNDAAASMRDDQCFLVVTFGPPVQPIPPFLPVPPIPPVPPSLRSASIPRH